VYLYSESVSTLLDLSFSLTRGHYKQNRDWDGVNDYEKLRADMIAQELGYIAFAADIYGADLHQVEDIDQRIALAGMYRDNATLFSGRIAAAVDVVKGMEEVDSDAVAMIGYCFGGEDWCCHLFWMVISFAFSSTYLYPTSILIFDHISLI